MESKDEEFVDPTPEQIDAEAAAYAAICKALLPLNRDERRRVFAFIHDKYVLSGKAPK